MKYPYKCSRCGACCLFETCPAGILVFKVRKEDRCPGLSFMGEDEKMAFCSVSYGLTGLVPIGDGCCIKARAYKNGVEYDFAALSPESKVKAVQQIRRKIQ